jgi:hypothetical protein
MEDEGRRMRLLAWHATCFAIHTIAAIYIANVGAGNDMQVQIIRIKSSWEDRGGGYGFTVAAQDSVHIRIDVITYLFFRFSALMHGIWVTFGLDYENSKRLLWDRIDACQCWWRWVEYAFSASLMERSPLFGPPSVCLLTMLYCLSQVVGIALVLGIREENTLLCFFALMATTMMAGLLTEINSRPDPRAPLDRWMGDPEDGKPGYGLNYMRRILPHILGFIPYFMVWWCIINNFFQQLNDLCEPLRERMPDFVPVIIFGCFVIFSSFTAVQLRYQYLAPRWYYRTEFFYCGLSATAKVFLGAVLAINVISKRSFNEAVAAGNYTATNLTALCDPVA